MALRNIFYLFLIAGIFLSCVKTYEASDKLDGEKASAILAKLSPFVLKKPDEISYRQRTDPTFAGFYSDQLVKADGKLVYFLETDTANLFFFTYRDRTSLFEHYRGLGGYYKTNGTDSIGFLNLLYHTPRLTNSEMASRGEELFEEMMGKGNVKRYLGNRDYVHTPNQDFYYNTAERRWDYTPDSSWKFLQSESAGHRAH